MPAPVNSIVKFLGRMVSCWICGSTADSREHRIKASDVRLHIGDVSPSNPMFAAPDGQRPKRISSSKSKEFTFHSLICSKCNNDRTRPYDLSWQSLSEYFYSRRLELEARGRFEPKKVFPGSSRKEMLNVHCYFIKLFGCQAKELGANLDYFDLSYSLLNCVPNSNFYLSFGSTPGLEKNERFALVTPMQVLENKNTNAVQAAFSFYIVGHVAVEMVYTPLLGKRPTVKGAWCATDRLGRYIPYREKYL